jgi:HD superfamily phosphohydrolase
MNTELVEQLSMYRLVVGYLGEREQFGWWQSSFFTQGSDTFLSPLFSQTQLLAQCNGVTRAAALLHDERIGVGNVYHLFRLPEDMEQSIHQGLHNSAIEKNPKNIISNRDSALQYLGGQLSNQNFMPGPFRIGKIDALQNLKVWQQIAGLYRHAFENKLEIFPYFSDLNS